MALNTYQTDIVIRGKKAEKYQEIKIKYEFELIDIYMISAVLGFLNNKKDIQMNDSNATANIPRTVLNNRSDKLDLLSQIILLHNEIEINPDEAVKIAFEEKKEDGEKLQRRELFYEYSLGGIDILYDLLSNTEYGNQIENLRKIVDKYSTSSTERVETADDIFAKEGL